MRYGDATAFELGPNQAFEESSIGQCKDPRHGRRFLDQCRRRPVLTGSATESSLAYRGTNG